MRTRTSILLLALLAIVTVSISAKERTIKGNGTIVTKNVSISDYKKISIAGSMDFEYTQSSESPFLEITVDENVFPYILVEEKGTEIIIGAKKIDENSRNERSYNLHPTVYKIRSNSKELKELSSAGSGNFNIKSPLNIEKLAINMAGSGNVKLEKQVSGNKLELNLAGSGKVVANDISLKSVSGNTAGSGGIQLEGTVEKASFSSAGSGNISAFKCKANTVDASLVGSGNIDVYATEKLNASIVSSGNVSYKGNPTVSKSSMGSGKVKKVD